MVNIRMYAGSSHRGNDWTEAFQHAVDDLRRQGGGVLNVPAGVYPTGSIRLYDNMTLNISSGAVLRFHQNKDAFPLISLEYEGNAGLMHQACIYAEGARNVVVTGYGTIDGRVNTGGDVIRQRRMNIQDRISYALLTANMWCWKMLRCSIPRHGQFIPCAAGTFPYAA